MNAAGALRLPRRIVGGRPRLFLGTIVGVTAWLLLLPAGLPRSTRAILAWDVGCIVFLGAIAVLFASEHRSRMQRDAEAQQEGEWTVFALCLAAAVASFAAIATEFSGTSGLPPPQKRLHVALVAVTLAVSWLVTQTIFALRYAHEYYTLAPGGSAVDGGLQFPGDDVPDYLDFMYFALVLGMTFQVSDVQITARKLRRLAALHGLLGFLFNTIIIALTVNIAAGLL